jgi:hypothetical protein
MAGDVFSMAGYMGSGIVTCICFLIFLYFAIKLKQPFPIILTVCCGGSTITAAWQYYQAQQDLSKLETDGHITKTPCGPVIVA